MRKACKLFVFYMICFFMAGASDIVYAENLDLENSVAEYCQSMVDRDFDLHYKYYLNKEKQLFDDETYAIFKKSFENLDTVVGYRIQKMEAIVDTAKVDVMSFSLKGDALLKLKFKLEDGAWKVIHDVPLTKELFQKVIKRKIGRIDRVVSLSPEERLAIFLIRSTKFLIFKKELLKFDPYGEKIKNLSYESFIRIYAKFLRESYSEEEITELNSFFQTQTGQKFIFSLSEINKGAMSFLINWINAKE